MGSADVPNSACAPRRQDVWVDPAADEESRQHAFLGQPPLISPLVRSQVIHFINKPMPGGLPKANTRALLDIEDEKIVPSSAIRTRSC